VSHSRRHRPEDAAGAAHPVGEDVGDRPARVRRRARAQQPLAGISAFAQLLLAEKRFPPDQRTAAETIYSEARRASRIVQNLLTFARQHKAKRC